MSKLETALKTVAESDNPSSFDVNEWCLRLANRCEIESEWLENNFDNEEEAADTYEDVAEALRTVTVNNNNSN